MIQEFDLRDPQQAFEFLFQFYNFVSGAKTNASRLTLNQNGRTLVTDITTDLQSFTSENTGRRKDDGGNGDDCKDNPERPRQGATSFSCSRSERLPHPAGRRIEGWTPLGSGVSPLNQARSSFDRYRLLMHDSYS